jgi:hypothetical protein
MQASARRAQRAIRSMGRRGLRERIPDPVRRQVLAYVDEARRAGEPWPAIAATVGLSRSALQRWRRRSSPSPSALRRVRVVPPAAAPAARELAVVTATGHRVEGLSLAEALAVVRALG